MTRHRITEPSGNPNVEFVGGPAQRTLGMGERNVTGLERHPFGLEAEAHAVTLDNPLTRAVPNEQRGLGRDDVDEGGHVAGGQPVVEARQGVAHSS